MALKCLNSHLQNVSDWEQEPHKHCIEVPELWGIVFSEIWPKNFILKIMYKIGTFSLSDKNLLPHFCPFLCPNNVFLVFIFAYIVKLAVLQRSFKDLCSLKIFSRRSIFVFVFGPFQIVKESSKLQRF